MIGVSTYQLLEKVLPFIDLNVNIQSVINNADSTYTLEICNTKWATVGFTITIQGNQYKIVALNFNSSLTVSGSVAPTPGSFNLYAPQFYHGSISQTDSDLGMLDPNLTLDSTSKLPMIWLFEPIQDESNDLLHIKMTHRESNCTMYFFVDANNLNANDDYYNFGILPMRQLADAWLEALKMSGLINTEDEMESVKTTDLPKASKYNSNQKKFEQLLSQFPLTGTQMKLIIPFINVKNCC